MDASEPQHTGATRPSRQNIPLAQQDGVAVDLPPPSSRPSRQNIPGQSTRSSRSNIPAYDPEIPTRLLHERIGHPFADPALLIAALTHPSWRNEQAPGSPDNQRLEFLGDAVVGLIITHELVRRLPERREGELTVLKSQLVRESSLAIMADRLGVGQALRLGRGEDFTGGRQRPSVLADAMEAIVGALLLDSGYESTREIVLRLFGDTLCELIAQVETTDAAALSLTTANWKTAAQELLQHHGSPPPTYSLVAEDGPDHARRFRVRAATRLGEVDFESVGEGPTKKAAENEAAAGLYHTVNERASGLVRRPASGSIETSGPSETGDTEAGAGV